MTYNIESRILLFFFTCMCIESLFLYSNAFLNVQVTPKWYACIFFFLLIGIFLVFCNFFDRKINVSEIIVPICLIISVLCLLQAVYGFLQYLRFFPSVNGFRITGSFDNPAGFASSLVAGFSCLFYFAFNKKRCIKYLSWIAIVTISAAVIYSASQAEMIALLVALATFLLYKFSIPAKSKMVILFITLTIAISSLYFIKKDSADGRLLIWLCSWEMIKDKPLIGHGYGGCKTNYINYQADYFTHNPNSKFTLLADNTNRPFNEYLLLLTNYGFTGFLVFFSICWFVWKSYLRRQGENTSRIFSGCLFSIAHECEQLWADYDLQMLIADNYQQLKDYKQAEQHYQKAVAIRQSLASVTTNSDNMKGDCKCLSRILKQSYL